MQSKKDDALNEAGMLITFIRSIIKFCPRVSISIETSMYETWLLSNVIPICITTCEMPRSLSDVRLLVLQTEDQEFDPSCKILKLANLITFQSVFDEQSGIWDLKLCAARSVTRPFVKIWISLIQSWFALVMTTLTICQSNHRWTERCVCNLWSVRSEMVNKTFSD